MSETEPSISIIGLPASGKTTLLAAIWHMVREAGSVTALKFAGLSQGNYEHLNALAARWRRGKKQLRTQTGGTKLVTMRLKDAGDATVQVSFPDMPGEDFSRMWEKRELDDAARELLATRSIALVVNGDTIQFPAWVADRKALAKAAGIQTQTADVVEWKVELAPTQVKLVELLQFLMAGDLNVGPRRLALLIAAWDRVEGDGLLPEDILTLKMPLLDQYLRNGRDPWTWRVWGVSAQGGVYEDQEKNEHLHATKELRELERPSDRIKVVHGAEASTDITLPLEWLIG